MFRAEVILLVEVRVGKFILNNLITSFFDSIARLGKKQLLVLTLQLLSRQGKRLRLDLEEDNAQERI
jgi:hypothetical protein